MGGVSTVTDNGESNREVPLAPGSTNVQIDIALDVSQMKSAFLMCTAACTLKTNSTSAPDATITLAAGAPIPWVAAWGGTNPYGGTDVTKVYATCADGGTLYLFHVVDATV